MAKWFVVATRDRNKIIVEDKDSKQEAIEEAQVQLAMKTGIDKPWKAWAKEGYKLRRQ